MYTIRRIDKTTSTAAIPNTQEERGNSISSSSSGTYFDFRESNNEPIHLRAARAFFRSGQQQQQQQQQQQPTTRLTPLVIDSLVKSLSRLIMKDPNTAGTPKPMSLEFIKRFLSQYHGIDSPADVDAVVKAFQQTHPDVKIAIATLQALREVQGLQNYTRAVASNYSSSSTNSNSMTQSLSPSSSLPLQQQQQQPQLSAGSSHGQHNSHRPFRRRQANRGHRHRNKR